MLCILSGAGSTLLDGVLLDGVSMKRDDNEDLSSVYPMFSANTFKVHQL